ncbi:transmembrane emp24 domain-containing protein p24delta4-like protein [Cinnamomum micranthum f. kanehirae]|uniref:Transmembrane emp24 domain-containing protein p24delta4-like protein n=1 Tax=Cinnamomum micranthum f. kanehirae TaxID=337451 RepID=A0A443PQ20_9MAGN|nr:transmembrane emp24 domain-containing protein p24delta4-like protein [Cinnamomum micranthum f. kanehirae]
MAKDHILRTIVWLHCMLGLLPSFGLALWLNLPPSQMKCVSEEIQTNLIALGDYTVVTEDDASIVPTISAKVTSPYGNDLHSKKKATAGQFAFTTAEAGNYMACFWVDGPYEGLAATVNIDWKIGHAAKDWDSVVKREKIQGVELRLMKLADIVNEIHERLLHMKKREAEMRELSETTNARIALFSIMSPGVCLGVSALQLLHLKHYFQKKKIV